MKTCVPIGIVVGLGLWMFASPSSAEDWTRFRGEQGSGISQSEAPTKWSPTENLKWKTDLPGAGVSSPIVIGDKIVLTCYSGYGVDAEKPGEIEELKRHVVCLDRSTGKILWNKTIDPVMPEDEYRGMGVPQHGYASHTPVTDGTNVYAFLGKSGVYAFDLEGNQLWHTSVGTESDDRRWGSASSPVVFENLVIVPAICEGMSIVALDKETGKQVWKQEADGLRSCWGSPIIVKVDDQRSDLVIGVPGEIWGLNPNNGKLRWVSETVPGDSFYTSVVSSNGVVYASAGGRGGGGSAAVKVGGKGDVSESHVVWTGGEQASFGSPVVANDVMFLVSRGTATTVDAKTGERLKRERLKSDAPSQRTGGRRGLSSDYASPVVAKDKLYYVKKNGETFVFSADKEFKQLAVNHVTEDDEEFSATPAICNGQIFLRSNKRLYCIESR